MSAEFNFPDRNLALELVRVTETAAIAASAWVGRGDKDSADAAAVTAMRKMINTVDMSGVIVIGEGEKDNAPMLHNGEEVGNGSGPACDVAVDPIDGTTLTSNGLNGAVSVIALAPRGTMFDPKGAFYMNKIVTGPEAAAVVDITAPAGENVRKVAKAKGVDVSEIYKKREPVKNILFKWGTVIIGIAVGLLIGNVIASNTGLDGFVAYSAMILLFGGVGMLIANFLKFDK